MQMFPKSYAFLRNSLLAVIALLLPVWGFAQDSTAATAEGMRANGKIYVVVLVISTIFVGIILFLIYLERRIRKIEKNLH